MAIQPLELAGQLAVARDHVKEPDHRNDGRVRSAQKEEEKYDANNPAEHASKRRRNRSGAELFANETQHIFLAFLDSGRDGAVALSDSRATLGCSGVDPGSSLITPVRLAIDSAPERARITPTNCTHNLPTLSCRGCKNCVVRCGALIAISATTMITVGNASAMAMLPLCLGPK